LRAILPAYGEGRVGSVDITNLALNDAYVTPVLAPKASKTLSDTITYAANAHSCVFASFDYWVGYTDSEIVALFVPITH
jgi:hypothetical protein